jgi:Glycosyltransferase family 87
MDSAANAQKLAVVVAVFLCAASWSYLNRVLIPHQKAESAARGIPRGNLSDLYPRWLGSRELLMHHRDPYGSDVTREIQAGYYGRPLDPALKNDPTDQQAFAYPVYVAFLLSPTVGMSFDQVQTLFKWMLGILTLASVPLWLRAVDWRLPPIATVAIALFVFSTFPVVQGIALQQLSLLVAPMIAACVFLLVQDSGIAAGALLGLATIKPQIAAPLAGWLLLWSASDFKRRWKFAAAFVFALIVLVSAGQLLLPGWIREFILAMQDYLSYNPSKTLLDGLLGHGFAVVVEFLLVAVTVLTCWRARLSLAGSTEFSRVTALVLAVNVLVIPSIAPYNQLLLLPGVFLVVRGWNQSQKAHSAVRIVRGTAAAYMAWYWISVSALTIASFFTPAEQRYWMAPLWASIVLPFLLSVCLALLIYFPPRPSSSAIAVLN